MNMAFSTKISLAIISSIFAYSNKIDIGDYIRGEYDMDTIFERFEDIKAAIRDPANIVYPYNDPEVRNLIIIGAQMVENRIGNTRARARALGNENMKFSDYLLQSGIDLDTLIDQLKITVGSLRVHFEHSTNLAMKEYAAMNEEGLKKNIEWLIKLQQTKNARAGLD